MDNSDTTKRMIGAVILVLIASMLLAWLLKGKNNSYNYKCFLKDEVVYSGKDKPVILDNGWYAVYSRSFKSDGCIKGRKYE